MLPDERRTCCICIFARQQREMINASHAARSLTYSIYNNAKAWPTTKGIGQRQRRRRQMSDLWSSYAHLNFSLGCFEKGH
jgi:hypothetical protein